VARLELEAITSIPSLDNAKLISVAGYLEESLILREKHSSRFAYAPVEKKRRHIYWEQRMRRIIQHINHRINEVEQKVQALTDNEVLTKNTMSKLEEKVEKVSVNETAFSCFLEDIERSLSQAAVPWSRFWEGKIPLSTHSSSLFLFLLAKSSIANLS
jgi:hypothetical protein